MQDNEPYVMSKKRTVRHIYWGRIIAVIIVLCLIVIGCALWFSRTSDKIKTASREYWFVSMGQYAQLSDASARADAVIESGGAGYVYGDSDFRVAASCYGSESDAVTVSGRLSESGESAGVFSVTCPAFTVEKPKENASLLKSMLARPAELFDDLYDISVKVDTLEISESAALYAALKMSVLCGECAQNCITLPDDCAEYLKKLFLSLSLTFDNLAKTKEKVPQSVKYALCETAVKICAQTNDFAEKIKNKS